jgi:hypothetical protein
MLDGALRPFRPRPSCGSPTRPARPIIRTAGAVGRREDAMAMLSFLQIQAAGEDTTHHAQGDTDVSSWLESSAFEAARETGRGMLVVDDAANLGG